MSKVKSPTTDVEAQRQLWFAGFGSRLDELDLWDVNLAGVLLFRSGHGAPGEPSRPTSLLTMRKRIGSLRGSGQVPAQKQRVRDARKNLEMKGLVKKREDETRMLSPTGAEDGPGTPYTWTLAWGFADEDCISPNWESAYEFVRKIFQRTTHVNPALRDAAVRLAFAVGADHKLSAPASEWAEILKVKSPLTARKRLREMKDARFGLKTLAERLEEGDLIISIEMHEHEHALNYDQLRNQAIESRRELWYPELVDRCVRKAYSGQNKKQSPKRVREIFYEPVLAMQAEFGNGPLIEYGLKETLNSSVFNNSNKTSWWRYMRTVCVNNRQKIAGPAGSAGGHKTSKGKGREDKLRALELKARDLLQNAVTLAGSGDLAEGRIILDEQLLPLAPDLAPLFDGDAEKAAFQLQVAFKTGSSDFISAKPSAYALDFMPDWNPQAKATAA